MKLIILEASMEEIRSNRTLGEILTETLANCFRSVRSDELDQESEDEDDEN